MLVLSFHVCSLHMYMSWRGAKSISASATPHHVSWSHVPLKLSSRSGSFCISPYRSLNFSLCNSYPTYSCPSSPIKYKLSETPHSSFEKSGILKIKYSKVQKEAKKHRAMCITPSPATCTFTWLTFLGCLLFVRQAGDPGR